LLNSSMVSTSNPEKPFIKVSALLFSS